MDPITHLASGALLGAACRPAPGARRTAMLAGAFAGTFPDVDVLFRLLPDFGFWSVHRGVTHSLPLLPLTSLACAAVFLAIAKGRRMTHVPGFAFLWLLSAGGVTLHILLDLLTRWGVYVFAPFSRASYAFGQVGSTSFTLGVLTFAGAWVAWKGHSGGAGGAWGPRVAFAAVAAYSAMLLDGTALSRATPFVLAFITEGRLH